MKLLLTTLLSMGMLFANSFQAQTAKTKLTPQEFQAKINELQDEIVLDVRTDWEFKSGHLENALNIDWYNKDFDALVGKLDKKQPLMVYCQAGGRSSEAADHLRKMGYVVYELEEGFAEWKAKQMPWKQ